MSTSWPAGGTGPTGCATSSPIRTCILRIGGQTLPGVARVIEGERDAVARRLLAAKYQGWAEERPLSSWAAGSLPVEVSFDS